MFNKTMDCIGCRHIHKKRVPGRGPIPSRIMIVGEAPGREEERRGKPFVGDSGLELEGYLLRAGILAHECYITNRVKCRPKDNEDPILDDFIHCDRYLADEIRRVNPQVIIAVGRHATRYFLDDDIDLERCHGIVTKVGGRFILPVYHPAYGLHQTSKMVFIEDDFQRLKNPTYTVSECVMPASRLVVYPGELDAECYNSEVIALDTESIEGDKPWCVTFYTGGKYSYMVKADNIKCLEALNTILGTKQEIILHNALYDIPVLRSMGLNIPINKVRDTMIGAYLLQNLSMSLKVLGYRLLGVNMLEYADVTGVHTQAKTKDYLEKVIQYTWDNPPQRLVVDKGRPRVVTPQNINKKIRRALKDADNADLYARWMNFDEEERLPVEAKLGKLYPGDLSDVNPAIALKYATTDAVVTYKIWGIIKKALLDEGLWDTFLLDNKLVETLDSMNSVGVAVDITKFKELSSELDKELLIIEKRVQELCGSGELLNLRSPIVVMDLVQRVYNMRIKSTSVDVLKKYQGQELIDLILLHREYTRLKTTYCDALPKKVIKGRVHTEWKNTRTSTGRLASANPNLQNQPVKSSLAKKLKQGFIASPGCMLVSSDYSQIEMRVLAHVSGDQKLIELFRSDEDVHAQTASRMFGVAVSQVDPETQRYPAKRVSFGVVYGIGPEGLYKQFVLEGLKYTIKECEDLINSWFDIYKGVKRYMDGIRGCARRYQMVRNMFGRIRRIPETKSSLPRIQSAGLRQAINAPIQSGAQDIIKKAMVALNNITFENAIFRCVLQIHDDLIYEVSSDIVAEAAEVIKAVMESVVTLSVPVPVGQKIGTTWGNMVEI